MLPFEVNTEPDLRYLEDSLPQLVADQLAKQGFSTVPPEKIRQILADQHIDFLDLKTAKDVALLAGAKYAVYGSFSQVGQTLSLDARLVDAFGLKPPKPLLVVKEGLVNVLPAVEELALKAGDAAISKQTIARISVQGTQVLGQDVVLMRLKVKKGDVYSPKEVNEDVKRLFDLGYFDDIQVKIDDVAEGKSLTFVVKEKPRIATIGVVGSDAIDSEDIIAAMSTKTGGVLNEKILSEDLNKIRELYHKKGYYLAKVDYKIERTADSPQARLNIVVEEGKKLYIKQIAIVGAKELDESDLKSELALAERGIFSWITGSGVLKEELLERDAAALEAYYQNRGFIEAKCRAAHHRLQGRRHLHHLLHRGGATLQAGRHLLPGRSAGDRGPAADHHQDGRSGQGRGVLLPARCCSTTSRPWPTTTPTTATPTPRPTSI